MAKYLIEVPHGADSVECTRAVHILLSTGSHFLMNADWGCHDGVHKAWFFAEVESKEEALMIVPPFYRGNTVVTMLNKFDFRKIDMAMKYFQARQELK
jgi:hypothetical protein